MMALTFQAQGSLKKIDWKLSSAKFHHPKPRHRAGVFSDYIMATDYKIRAISYQCHEYRCEVVNADGKTVTIDLAGQDQHKLERAG